MKGWEWAKGLRLKKCVEAKKKNTCNGHAAPTKEEEGKKKIGGGGGKPNTPVCPLIEEYNKTIVNK